VPAACPTSTRPAPTIAGDVTPSDPSRVRRSARATVEAAGQVLLLGVLFTLYKWARFLGRDRYDLALANARRVVEVERLLHLDVEREAQRLALGSLGFVRLLNHYYASVHFGAMVVFLCWLYLRDRDGYRHVRFVLVAGSAVALAIHLAFPLAPPRMLVGFVDTTAVYGPNPYGSGAAQHTSNQIAAMPSLHFMWAALVAYGVVRYGRSRARWLVVAHPVITATAIVVTANHYVADALVAATIMMVAIVLAPSRPAVERHRDLWCPLLRIESTRARSPQWVPVTLRSRQPAYVRADIAGSRWRETRRW
jgi:hypothetical protein